MSKKFRKITFLTIGLLSILLVGGKYLKEKQSCPEDSGNQLACWKEVIEKTLDKKGLDVALEKTAFYYQTEPDFAANCHDYMHLLGKETYELFSKNLDFKLTDKTSYCSYGFFHGFMQTLVSKEGSVDSARNFCRIVDSQLSKISPSAELACYHGIGHGWTNTEDKSLWGNEQAMVVPALSLCEQVAETDHQLEICATGVFDSISIGYYNEAYGLKMKKEDPLWLCREQEVKFKKACYMDMMPAIVWLGEHDLGRSLSYLKFVEKDYVSLSTLAIAENNVRYILNDRKDIFEALDVCRGLGGSLTTECLKGLVGGLIQFGPVKKEYTTALDLCTSNKLLDEEKEICYSYLSKQLLGRYPKNEVDEICKMYEGEYRVLCEIE